MPLFVKHVPFVKHLPCRSKGEKCIEMVATNWLAKDLKLKKQAKQLVKILLEHDHLTSISKCLNVAVDFSPEAFSKTYNTLSELKIAFIQKFYSELTDRIQNGYPGDQRKAFDEVNTLIQNMFVVTDGNTIARAKQCMLHIASAHTEYTVNKERDETTSPSSIISFPSAAR